MEILLAKAHGLLRRSPDALHVLAVSGYFSNQEAISELKQALQSLLPGRVIPVINSMKRPRVLGQLLRLTLCDFVVSEQLPPALSALIGAGRKAFTNDEAPTPLEFVERTKPPEEFGSAQEVEDELGLLK